jgi:hypothetical protein
MFSAAFNIREKELFTCLGKRTVTMTACWDPAAPFAAPQHKHKL